MTKQEIIKEAYGEHWDKVCEHVDENGIVSMIVDNIFVTPSFKDLGFTREFVDESIISWYDSDKNIHFWQLKSLKGIEDNNGWIKIESEEDLPKCGEYWTIANFDNSIIERVFPHPKFSLEFNKEWWLKYITHYKPIEKRKPPIY